ncbi:hypothetical protein COV20_05955 [Candidatus Woesearchaeota archaeon CG10_big_fil_rev_8_21_14_0_10_45_16]|nr:MAG: hypothetical protein COV20_05955 [Candidatus Woesearchaeota archaeon CG10_big_fil_rev_8_21_14_0_10_45_16]
MSFTAVTLALAAGIGSGIITGLIPGVHVNLIAVIALSLSSLLLEITSATTLAVYIISLAVTHSFLDSIPSIYLGAPDEAQALNALPGHRLLMQGLGHQAVMYTLLGSFGTLVVGIIVFPLALMGMKFLAPFAQHSVGYLLIGIMIYMTAREKKKWLRSLTIFLLAGCLGLLVLGTATLKQPLLPLLSGLFGFSILLISLLQKSIVPEQKEEGSLNISKKNTVKAISAASGIGFIAAFLPGFGNSQAAIIATNVVGDIGDEGFLTLVGGINTANFVLSIGTIYALEKARNGAIVAVQSLLGTVTIYQVVLFLVSALLAGAVAVLLAIRISKIFARIIPKINYAAIVWTIVVFITAMTIFFDGLIGLVILLTATALGILTQSWGVGKNHLMGCLILPVILFFVL